MKYIAFIALGILISGSVAFAEVKLLESKEISRIALPFGNDISVQKFSDGNNDCYISYTYKNGVVDNAISCVKR